MSKATLTRLHKLEVKASPLKKKSASGETLFRSGVLWG